MIFKHIETENEWSEAIRLRNLFNWSYPVGVDESKAMFEHLRQERKDFRFVGVLDGQVVTYNAVTENANSPDGDYWFNVCVDPNVQKAKEWFGLGVKDSMRQVSECGGSRALIEGRGEYGWVRESLEEMDFQKDQVQPYSCLDVLPTEYDYQDNVVSFAEFLEANGEDGMYRLWRCEMEIAADLPMPYDFIETPLEIFSSHVLSPINDLTSKFLLVEDGEVKGLSQLWPSKVNPKLAANGLTGVRRAYRRQGVATRLKQHGIAWAKDHGIEQIFTDNEENNPMFQLNLQLGFRRLFDYEVYSKSC